LTRKKPVAERVCEASDACPVVDACLHEGRTPCLDLSRAHTMKLRLCDELEMIADSLPAQIDRLLCLRIASELVPQLRECHHYEEKTVFPAFLKGGTDTRSRSASIRRLESEHVQDECAAQDLTDVLLAVGHGAPIDNPEAFGFMLRAFFEALRRHVAFEHEHLLPELENPRGVAGA
jgi:hemerythrin-like domain-containing protein